MAFNLSTLSAQQQAAAIYIGYYDRAPDPYGMDFWEAAVTNPIVSLVDIATYFSAQDETYAVHPFFVAPSASAANAFISELYLNLFNRAPDMAGLTFWSGVLQQSIDGTGPLSVGEIILAIIEGAQNSTEGQDITTLLNKIAVANAWTDAAAAAGLTEANSYADSEAAQTSAKSIINDVTFASSSVDEAKSVITTTFDDFVDSSKFTLTADAPSILEGDSGTKVLVFKATLDEAPTQEISVNYETLSSGTAASGDDYVAVAGVVNFAAGQTVATVSVTVLGDAAFEADETIEVKFSGARLTADVTATGTITNDDLDPQVALEAAYSAAKTTYDAAIAAAATSSAAATAAQTAADLAETAVNSLETANAYSTAAQAAQTAAAAAQTDAAAVVTAAAAVQAAAAATPSIADDTDVAAASTTALAAKTATDSAKLVADAEVANAAAQIVNYTGQVYTLTTALDNVNGSTANDVINGSVEYTITSGASSVANTSTFTVVDQINAGGGTDVLNLAISGGIDGGVVAIPAATVTNVEKLFIRNVASEALNGTDSVGIDASLFAGLTEVWSDRSSATLTVSNLATGATFGVKGNGTVVTNDTMSFGYATATDAISLALADGVKAGANTDITVSTTGSTAATITSTGAANSVDVVTLHTGGATVKAATINATTAVNFGAGVAGDQEALTGFAADTTITITGAGAVDLEIMDADVDTIDASTNSGGIQVTLDNENNTKVTGSSGNDIITTGASLTTGSVNAGAGIDKLVVGTNVGHIDTATEASKFTNFETLSLNGTLDVSLLSGITAIELSGATNNISKLSATQAGSVTATADIGATTIALANSSGTSDALTLIMGDGKGAAFDAGALTINGFETLNVTANPLATSADKETVIASFNADKLTAINLTGSSVDLRNAATTKAVTIDGSALTGTLKVGGNLVAGSTVNAGAGKDVLTLGTVGSTYNGGANDDTFVATAVTQLENGGVFNTIDGGAGTDTLTVTANAVTLVDSHFSKMSNLEKIIVDADGGTGAVSFTTGGFYNSIFAAGGSEVTLLGADTDVITFTGNTFTGDQKVTVTSLGLGNAASEDISVTTGSGSDTVTVTAASWVGAAGAASNITINTGAGADTISLTTGDLLATTTGVISIDAGEGADIITVAGDNGTTDTAVIRFDISDGDTTAAGRDKITGFERADGTDRSDVLNFDAATVAANTGGGLNGADAGTIKSHSITNGTITFDNVDTFATAETINTSNLGDALAYVAANITTAGNTVAFAYDSDDNGVADATIVFNQGANDSVVELVGLTGVTALSGTNATTDGLLSILSTSVAAPPVTPPTTGGGTPTTGTPITTPVAVAQNGQTFDAAAQNTTFDVADGTFAFTINNFAAGDILDFRDVAGATTQATFNVLADANQTDGQQQFTITDPSDASVVTVTLVGLSGAQDAGLFNQGSVDSVFGTGTLLL